MGNKIEIMVKERFRITIPDNVRDHLKLKKGDNLWYELTKNGKVILGKIEINKKFID